MTKYTAKCTVFLEIDSDYPDGIGEAQTEVRRIVNNLKYYDEDVASVYVAHAVDIEILRGNKLRKEMGECDIMLFYGDVCLDDGMR